LTSVCAAASTSIAAGGNSAAAHDCLFGLENHAKTGWTGIVAGHAESWRDRQLEANAGHLVKSVAHDFGKADALTPSGSDAAGQFGFAAGLNFFRLCGFGGGRFLLSDGIVVLPLFGVEVRFGMGAVGGLNVLISGAKRGRK
jgi:hypothetical protein